MSPTKWERTRAVSDRLRAAFDAERGAYPADWPSDFEVARKRTLEAMQRDYELAREMTYEDFLRMQGVQA